MLFQSYATEAKDNNGSYFQTAFNFQPILKSKKGYYSNNSDLLVKSSAQNIIYMVKLKSVCWFIRANLRQQNGTVWF